MCLVHKFEQLVDNGLQEFPVRLEESWILPNNVHNIGRNDGFIVFPPLYFYEAE